MRRFLIAAAALVTVAAAVCLAPNRAGAMTLPAPIGIQGALQDLALMEKAYHRVCRRVCSYYGCTYRCYRPAHHYYRPYRYYRPHRYYRSYRYY